MSAGVSVIICCFNSARRLPETLRHLAAQQVTEETAWEVVVVDNASTDETAEVARRCWPTEAAAPLRVVLETEAGLSHARVRGMREARYDVISFIDDDNWAAGDWISRVSAIFAAHPEIGGAGGRMEEVCEIAPPGWFQEVKAHYAVGPQHLQSGDVTNSAGTLLCGAGLNLRTGAVRKLLADGFVFLMSGRKENRLSMGEDSELCFALRASGWRFWYDDELVLKHFIPQTRLRWDYAVRLMRGLGESSPLFTLYLCALKAPPFERYPVWKATWVFQTSKALRQFVAVILSHPEACFRQREGSVSVLEFERSKSRLAGLWALFGRYGKVQEGIRRAAGAWARP